MLYHCFKVVSDFNEHFSIGDIVLIDKVQCVVSTVDAGVLSVQQNNELKVYCIDDLYDRELYKGSIHYLPH